MMEFIHHVPDAFKLDPMLIVAVVLVWGATGGWLARLVRLPTITGNILAGILIGPALGLLQESQAVNAIRPISSFAMSLITVTIGGHLSYRRIHNALWRITWISVFEAAGAGMLVWGAMWLLTHHWATSMLLGSLAVATAPATILNVVCENRAKGPVVKTLLSAVAIDNILAIVLFAVATTLIAVYLGEYRAARASLLWTAWGLAGAVLLGLLIGCVTEFLSKRSRLHSFSIVFVAVLAAAALSRYLGVSPLLTSLVFGVYLANSSADSEEQLNVLEPINPILFVCFFTFAGMTLHLRALAHAGLLGLIYVVARLAGKMLGASAGGIIARASPRIWQNVGLALAPQAGLAIALAVLLQVDERLPSRLRTEVSTLVLAAVVVNEIIGPIFTRFALRRANEDNKDHPRLIEFLQEEFIRTGLKARTKTEAIRELCEFLILTHRARHVNVTALYDTVLEREAEMCTALGHGVALPHGRIEKGPAIQGVLGISPAGIDWGAPDGQPVKIIVLIATPANHEQQHLPVLAALSAMVSDPVIRARLAASTRPDDAWEVIEGKETPDYNYFLKD